MVDYFVGGFKAYIALCKASALWLWNYFGVFALMCVVIAIPYIAWWCIKWGIFDDLNDKIKAVFSK